MNWTGPQKGNLRTALIQVHGWRGVRSLEIFISDNFDYALYDVGGDNPEDWSASLIDKADAEGWITQLYHTLCDSQPGHDAIQKLQVDIEEIEEIEEQVQQDITYVAPHLADKRQSLGQESLNAIKKPASTQPSSNFAGATFNAPVNFAPNYGNQAQHQTIGNTTQGNDSILSTQQAQPNLDATRKEKQRAYSRSKPNTEPTILPTELPEAYDDIELEAFLPEPSSIDTDVGQFNRTTKVVCRIVFADRAVTGTGVLLAPNLVLTNYHILSKELLEEAQLTEAARSLIFEFGRTSDRSSLLPESKEFYVDQKTPIAAASPPEQLDYVLLKLSLAPDAAYYRPVSIASKSYMLQRKDSLTLLHHPEGAFMQASLSASGVVDVNVDIGRLWYVNRTKGGSSGAPCFNNDWEMVALHHATTARGFGSIREGILMSAILADIEAYLPERSQLT